MDGTDDVFPPWPNDWDAKLNDKMIKDAINKIKDSGNFFFYKNNYVDSERKYKKALRYIDWFLASENDKADLEHVEELRINSLLNLAAVRLKRNKFKQVLDLCTQVNNVWRRYI